MLSKRTIEKLRDQCTMRVEQDGDTVWCQLDAVKFARLAGAAELRRAAQRFDRGYLDTLRTASELRAEATAAERAAKETK